MTQQEGSTVKDLARSELWFVTGSMSLYGDAVLRQVADDARGIAAGLDSSPGIPTRVVYKQPLTTPEGIRGLCLEANADPACVGLVLWMHTFSPAKMWIAGLQALQKPFLHLHTQFNRDLPWSTIDMDFMNLNQSAHGDREFAYLASRMRLARATVAGHWQDPTVGARIGRWARAACGWDAAHGLRIARFGDNMRHVAVTEGDKTEAQRRFGFSVNGYGVSDLAQAVRDVADPDAQRLVAEYDDLYEMAPTLRASGADRHALVEAARIEVALRTFLEAGGFGAFTDTFEDLGSLVQLPGIAVQRLMAEGYGFGAEGDWKSAALVRIMKVMAEGLDGGTSFMEDYTYHFGEGGSLVLGAHMLEICPTITRERPSCEIHPLSIGGKADPVRLVFSASSGPAIAVGLLDLGDRFRLVLNEVDVVPPVEHLGSLPVARAVWAPRPDLATAAEAWLLAGGPHHTSFSQSLTADHLGHFADIAGVELVTIDGDTHVAGLRKELRWSDAAWRLGSGH
ncbi:MAG: L-arabinose isomerase [Candidatus Limnocylindrales bacterium]